ncbi:MAG: outer membrane beta-barrel protein [Hyphomicrobiaceae bacterium]
MGNSVRGKDLSYFISGFALATIAGVVLRASPANAQGVSETTIPKVNQRVQTSRGQDVSRIVRTVPQVAEPAEAAPSVAAAVPTRRGDGDRDVLPEDGEDPTRVAQARERQDGDPEPLIAPGAEADGDINVAAPVAAAEGTESVAGDNRSPEDRAAFETPAAGYDALAFQIELDPATDRRPARLARFEPYTPKGVRAGSWVIFPEIESGFSATNNALRGTDRRSDLIFDVRPTLRAVTDWKQHAIDVKASGFLSQYRENDFANERAYLFEARGRFDLGKRTNIEVLGVTRRDPDSPSDATAADSIRGRANFVTQQAAMALNHRFNRLSVQLRGSLTDVEFDGGVTNAGVFRSNAERNSVQRDLSLRAAWAFKPTLSVFSEYALNDRRFETAPTDGISRDSDGDRIRFGVSFGNTAKIWRGEVAVGYGRQNGKDSRLTDAAGVILDANLAWRPSELTSLLWSARSDLGTSTDVGKFNSKQQLYGVELRHGFQRNLIGMAGIKTQATAYEGISLNERETTAEMGLDYYVSHAASVSLHYQHLWFNSSAAAADYSADTVRVAFKYKP